MFQINLKLFEEYLTLKHLSPRTRKEYLYYGVKFQSIGAFNTGTITRFLIDKGNQNNVARAFVLILKKFLMFYKDELQLTQDEINEVAQAEVPSITGRTKTKIVIPLSKAEIDLIEQTLESEELKLMLLVCYNGGLRLQELIGIRISSFNWARLKENPGEMGEVRVFGKGGKEGICILPNWLIVRLGAYIKANSKKYSTDSRLFSISGRTFEGKLRDAGIKAGLSRKDDKGEYLHNTIVYPHRLRHSYAGNLLKKGVDIRYIKEALRHTSISSTQIYTQLSKEDLKEKLEGLQ